MKPHKHAELIKAWADGAEIERCGIGSLGPWTLHDGAWDVAENYDFRIKQEPKPDVVRYYTCRIDNEGIYRTALQYNADLVLVYDGETHKLKKAEVL